MDFSFPGMGEADKIISHPFVFEYFYVSMLPSLSMQLVVHLGLLYSYYCYLIIRIITKFCYCNYIFCLVSNIYIDSHLRDSLTSSTKGYFSSIQN